MRKVLLALLAMMMVLLVGCGKKEICTVDGVHTGWRSWWDATKLFVQHIRVSWKNWNKIITADRIAFYFALC